MLFWVGTLRHRLSTKQIVSCFKLKKLENYMRYQVNFLLPLKLRRICYFGLWPQKNSWSTSLQNFLLLFDFLILVQGLIATLHLLLRKCWHQRWKNFQHNPKYLVKLIMQLLNFVYLYNSSKTTQHLY